MIPEINLLKERLRLLPNEMPSILKGIFEEIAPAVEDLIILQLDRGERGDGSSLPFYSITSVTVFGKKPGPMNLHDRGDFWRGITLVVTNEGIDFIGRDIKTEDLVLRYGEAILELQESSIEIIQEDFLVPEIDKKLNEIL